MSADPLLHDNASMTVKTESNDDNNYRICCQTKDDEWKSTMEGYGTVVGFFLHQNFNLKFEKC